jgi:putative transposase
MGMLFCTSSLAEQRHVAPDSQASSDTLRANLVKRAEDWRWSSLHRWYSGTADEKNLLSAWPLRRSTGWLEHVNSSQTDAELTALRRSVNRGSPFGDETWATSATRKLGLEITTRSQEGPQIPKNGS